MLILPYLIILISYTSYEERSRKAQNESQLSGFYLSSVFPKHRVREGSRNFCSALYRSAHRLRYRGRKNGTVERRKKETESSAHVKCAIGPKVVPTTTTTMTGTIYTVRRFVALGGRWDACTCAHTYTRMTLCTRALWRTVIHWSTVCADVAWSSSSSLSLSSMSFTTSTTSGWWWW